MAEKPTQKMSQRERMLAGLLYNAADRELCEARIRAKHLTYLYNTCDPADMEKRAAIMKEIIGEQAEHTWIEARFYCDYGTNIEFGDNFYSNVHFTVLDCAKVTFGHDVMIGPNVDIYTAGHPVHPETRCTEWEYAMEVKIGDRVWIGGRSVINPGVTALTRRRTKRIISRSCPTTGGYRQNSWAMRLPGGRRTTSAP